MKKLCYFISFLFLLLTFAGCENDGTLNENSEIVVVGLGHKVYNLPLGNEILFTGNDIKWFNRDTREIRFYDHSVFKEKLDPVSYTHLDVYKRQEFPVFVGDST